MNRYFENINGNKHLILVPNSEGKQKIIKKHRELWIKSRDLISLITKGPDDYDEKYM